MLPWLAAGGLGLAGAVLYFYERWKRQRAEDEVVLWRTQAKRAAAELADLVAAGREERTRQEGVIREQATQLQAVQSRLAGLARAHPELVRDYLRGVLEDVAATAPGAPAHSPLLGPATPAATPGGGERDR